MSARGPVAAAAARFRRGVRIGAGLPLVFAAAVVCPAQSGSLLKNDVGPGPSRVAAGQPPATADGAARQRSEVRPAPLVAPRRQRSTATSAGSSPANELAADAALGGPLTIRNTSWTYEAPQAARVYRLNDIVTIRVDEISRMAAEGNLESRRNSLYDSILQEWVKLDSLDSLNPAAQKEGDPRVQMANNSLNRADSRLQSRQSLTFNIAARVVDIRPNGDLVLEARKTIVYNDNAWETALSGICRPVDIAADNVVLSRDLLDLQVRTQERGEMRDGYRRGWFAKLVGRLFPY